ncbi:MAG: bifunctional phosphopantothenoylcysteine decarboxylase/phosphopantothenate--cysteine ligase CoaBC [Kiritimatiellae bacterium]|jgi:phosphopantothenoylcysteine decarboxylase/phosphopantothenate--cysteine ligase|nr:bifunctional phosphopantothenoylcysteine decarboxylase/phosphopantothenate--cysteine ligase CoaBC [Kiritimatiellia bacterium]
MKILITAGPTREYLDPVRFMSNRSTGKMGFAIAEAAVARGHEVTLISGPVILGTPPEVSRIDIETARDMLAAVQKELPEHDALVMCAAVSDFRPKITTCHKLKKSTMPPVIELIANPDILHCIQPEKGNRIFVGFAAETDNIFIEAERKLKEKGLDLIVANDITQVDAGFEVDTNRVTLIHPEQEPEKLPLMSKAALGEKLIEFIESKNKANCTPSDAGSV